MIKLRPFQQKVYNRFVKGCASKPFKFVRIIIDAPRRSGKTMLLQYIIENNKNRFFWIVTSNFKIFELFYGKYKNCKYYNSKEHEGTGNNMIHYKDIFIGDEVFLSEMVNTFICAGTFGFQNDKRVTKWRNPYKKDALKQILSFKKKMPPRMWNHEFGNYLTK